MRFDWDKDKARENLRRHGVSFWAAKTAFRDPFRRISEDELHSRLEERQRLVGHAVDGRLLVVTFTERPGTIRIISAWRATKRERHDYENG